MRTVSSPDVSKLQAILGTSGWMEDSSESLRRKQIAVWKERWLTGLSGQTDQRWTTSIGTEIPPHVIAAEAITVLLVSPRTPQQNCAFMVGSTHWAQMVGNVIPGAIRWTVQSR